MESDNHGGNFSSTSKELPSHGPMNQKENIIKFPESVQGDGRERPIASGQRNNAQHGSEIRGKNASDAANKSSDNAKSEEANVTDENATSKPNQYRPTIDSAKPDNLIPVPENQKYMSETSKSASNLQQNTFRPLDNTYGKPGMAPGMQVRPSSNNPMPGQPIRKPDGSPIGYQQPYPNQARQYQMPNAGYSTPSYQPSPQSQTYSSPQPKGEMPRPGFSPQNQTPMTTSTNIQRTYPHNQSYADLPQQRIMNQNSPRPSITQPILNRPQMYQNNPQRILPENYQKSPSMQPVRANYANNPTMPLSNPNQQYYNSMRTAPLSPNVGSTPGYHSNLGDPSLRYKTDANVARTPSPLANTLPDSRANYAPTSLSTDPNRNIRQGFGLDPMGARTTATGEIQANPLPPVKQEVKVTKETIPVAEGESVGTGNKGKEEKEPGIVHTNVKYFEERDTAKVPLTPQISSPVRPAPPSRSATFIAGNVIKGELYKEDEYESGVDVTPLLHPNLRSVTGVTFDFSGGSGRSRDRNRKNHNAGPESNMNNSYPSTPIKFTPRLMKSNSHRSMSRSPSKTHKSIFELTPEEEFLYFFNIARASYNNFYGRNSRIDEMSHRKENMPTTNGDVHAAKKTPTKLPAPSKRSLSASSPTKTPLKSPGVPKSLPKTPDSPAPPAPLIKKVPMNKIQVGAAPSPNLKAVKSKIGSLANTTHKPGGGNIKIESHKIDFSKAQARIAAKNDTYAPGGGDKKIQQVKLQWSAKPKVGSLENAAHKPGGGDKKIESVKLDFKDKAKPKVGSKDNVKHVPGGGAVKNSVNPPEWDSMNIENQKLEFKAQSKVGSLDNVKHKPGGGDVKIFDDKTYLKQISCGSSEGRASGTQSPMHTSVSKSFSETSQDGS